MNRLTFGVLIAASFVAVSCGGEPPADPSVTRSDSSGVRIVSSAGADRPLPWRFDTLDVLRDSLGEPWLFTGVTPQMVLTDRAGRTYVLEREPAIRRFGRDGRYERSIGRKGGAPGEMQFPMALVQQGDSIGVVDVERQAIVRWEPGFEPLSDIPLRDGFANVTRAAFRSGGFWVERFAFDSVGSRTLLVADTVGGDPLLTLEHPNRSGGRMLTCGQGGQSVALRQPTFFAPTLHWDARGPRIIANVGPAYDLRLYEGARLIASVRRDLPDRVPTIEDARRLYPEGMKISVASFSCTIPLEELTEGAQFANVIPWVHGLVLLSDGTIWVQRSFRNEKPVVLDVFGSDGAYSGSITGMHLPVGLLPNGELLVPTDDEDSGGLVIARMQVVR